MLRLGSLLLLASFSLAACASGDADSPAGEGSDPGADVTTADASADASTLDMESTPDDVSVAGGVDTVPGAEDTQDTAAEDVAPPIEVPSWGLAFAPEELEGTFVFGISSDPMSALSMIGQVAVGVNAVRVQIELSGDLATVRALDWKGDPVKSDAGIIESYPLSFLDDGRALIDLRTPLAGLEVQLYAGCTYMLTQAEPSGAPMYADNLITWPMLETYASSGTCNQGALETSVGVNVHYLLRADANPSYQARTVDPNVPFGYFIAGDPTGQAGGTTLDRMALPSDPADNGAIRYHIAANLPEELMPAVHAVFESWNDVVESVTGVRPLSYERATADMIPWDPRYRSINWDPSQTMGAVAPFQADPLTGEMFSTSVILWIGNIQLIVAEYVDFLEKHPDAPWVGYGVDASTLRTLGPVDMGDDSDLPPRVLRRHVFDQRPFDLGVVRDVWLRNGQSKSPEELSLDVLAEFLVHEMGHNFGLRHNFKGSIDRDGHPADAPSSTVMDYIIGMGKPGTYDVDAIRYGYGTGAESTAYLYCTDEDVSQDPGCAQWDFGHPLGFALGQYDAIAASVPVDQDPQKVQNQSKQEGWNDMFNHLRDFINSEYQTWDPDAPIDAFGEQIARVVCEGECLVNPWLRAQLVNYLLRTQHKGWGGGGMGGGGIPYPALDEAQATTLFDTLFTLVTDEAQPLYLRTTIVQRLGKAQLGGSIDVLTALGEYFAAVESPTEDQAAVMSEIQAATPGGQPGG